MATLTSSQRFLGMDLQLLRRDLRDAWRQLLAAPPLRWLTPDVPVRVLLATGEESVWVVQASGAIARPAVGRSSARTPFTALELPDDLLLLRRLRLPALTQAEIFQAVSLDVAGANPFPEGDAVWGWRASPAGPGLVDVQVALASRAQVSAHLEARGFGAAASSTPEVWAMSSAPMPVVVTGFGEGRRLSFARRRRWMALGLSATALGLAMLVIATPVIQKRMRAVQAVTAFDALNRKAEPALKQRAELVRAADTAGALKEILAQRADPLYVMDVLTKALPDDTSLLGVQVQGAKVTINGMTGDAAALMQQLSGKSELKDIKAPVAATRPLGALKEVFALEMTLVPRASPAPQAAAPAGNGSGVVLSALGIPMPAASGAAVAPPKPPSTGGASFGGASFGGGAVRAAPPASEVGKQP